MGLRLSDLLGQTLQVQAFFKRYGCTSFKEEGREVTMQLSLIKSIDENIKFRYGNLWVKAGQRFRSKNIPEGSVISFKTTIIQKNNGTFDFSKKRDIEIVKFGAGRNLIDFLNDLKKSAYPLQNHIEKAYNKLM